MLRKDPFITGEYYHIYNRGIDKRTIFKSKKDYERFTMLLYLGNSNESFRLDDLINKRSKIYEEILVLDRGEPLVSIGGWALMPNHFHILLRQEVEGGITKFMKKLGTGYSMYFNIRHERQGALFGGPFKSKLVKDDKYMVQLFVYLHLNPLDIMFLDWKNKINKSSSDMKKFLESYVHSSYKDLTGFTRVEKNIINLSNFPDYFSGSKSFSDLVEDFYIE